MPPRGGAPAAIPAGALETAAMAADAAGAAIRPFFRAADRGVEIKLDLSPVTLADRAAEEAMRAVIGARHPDHAILGEEGGETGVAGARWRWVLDPIDGTRAFITGRPVFTTLVALMSGAQPLLGVIDQPMTGERWMGTLDPRADDPRADDPRADDPPPVGLRAGETGGDTGAGEARGGPERAAPWRGDTIFFDPWGGEAARSNGRMLAPVAPARSIPVRPDADALAGAELSATSPAMFTDGTRARFERLASRVGRVSWGGDAYAYGLLALGQIDVIAEASMKIWDWAALVPVVEGAGGLVTDWAGAPLRADGDGTVLAAGSAALHRAALAALRD